MSEAPPLPNDPASRTPTGEIKDVSQPLTSQTTSTNPTEPKPNEPAPDPKLAEPAAGPPEKYADYTLPEGYKPDLGAIEQANTVFKELGLTQAQAQKLIDIQASREVSSQKSAETAIAAQREAWDTELKSDPEIGSRLDQTKSEIGKVMQQMPEGLRTSLQAQMDATGMGNNPALVKAFAWFAKQINEPAAHVQGSGPAALPKARPPAASAMYPNLPQ